VVTRAYEQVLALAEALPDAAVAAAVWEARIIAGLRTATYPSHVRGEGGVGAPRKRQKRH
jgi:hypothetical protein